MSHPIAAKPPAPRRPTLGIIAGSGPEAGIDLWGKVLARNQNAMGPAFRGDLDAPKVVILSEPTLGLSMELEANDAVVWPSLRKTVAEMAVQADIYAIACNTLNWYAPRIAELRLPGEFLSFQTALTEWIAREGIRELALLGAAPVTGLGPWSAYRALTDLVRVETPREPERLHDLIHDVKRLGGRDPSLPPRLRAIVDDLTSRHVLLACTELPLIAGFDTDKTLVDVTDLVAEAMVARTLPRSADAAA